MWNFEETFNLEKHLITGTEPTVPYQFNIE